MPTQGNGSQVSWYVGSDMNVWVEDLYLEPDAEGATPTYLTNATITGAMTDTTNNPVTNASSIPFSYVSGNRYRGRIPYNAALTRGGEYWLDITVEAATGERLRMRLQGTAIYYGGVDDSDE